MRLFKYFHPISKHRSPKSVDIIEQLSIRFRSVRFSPLDVFNDPFELLPDTAIVETPEFYRLLKPHYVSEIKAQQPLLNEEQTERECRQRFEDNVLIRKREAVKELLDFRPARILCLSKIAPDNPKALLLWAHYTENHAGMVLEFDDAHPWIQQHTYKQGERHDYKEVQYSTKRVGWNGLEPAEEFLYTKSQCWIYEQEVRLIRFVGDKEFDTSKVDALVKYPPEMLLSVTLGVNNTQETDVREALAASHDPSHVVLYRAELHLDEYNLTLKKLSR